MVVATSHYHMRSVSNEKKGKAKNDSMFGAKIQIIRVFFYEQNFFTDK
jgi:hypothetical protein